MGNNNMALIARTGAVVSPVWGGRVIAVAIITPTGVPITVLYVGPIRRRGTSGEGAQHELCRRPMGPLSCRGRGIGIVAICTRHRLRPEVNVPWCHHRRGQKAFLSAHDNRIRVIIQACDNRVSRSIHRTKFLGKVCFNGCGCAPVGGKPIGG